MAAITVDTSNVSLVKWIDGFTGPAAELITAGQYCRYNKTSGEIELGNATTADEAHKGGFALQTIYTIGETLDVLSDGKLDIGKTALNSLDYGVDVYLSDTDGGIATTPGTRNVTVGTVEAVWNGTTPSKILRVNTKKNV